MKNILRATCATSTLLAIVFSTLGSSSPIQSPDQNSPGFDRSFTQRFNTVSIENPQGRTQVQTWSGNRVRVMAWSQGAVAASAFDARIRFQMTSPEALGIVVRTRAQDNPINLSVIVPRQINLYVKGGTESVDIKGATAALSVETDTGGISLHLPATANANLALRAVEGTITSKLPLTIFGPVNTHSLDGSLGQGGAPVILRSAQGAIDLLPDEATRLVRADAKMLNVPNNATAPRIIKSSKVLQPDTAPEALAPGSEPDVSAFDQTDAAPGAALSDATNSGPKVNRNDPPVDDIIKIDTRLVNLNVKVTDGAGKLIPDLTKDDFQIFENNIEQQVVLFEPVTSPVNLVLLLDLSGSTRDRMKIMKKAAKKFIEFLKPNTRIAVAAFTRRFMLISDFTDDRKLLKDRIDNIKNFNSGTAFYDASWSTLDLFKDVKERRKAIVMLTDGVDNSLSSAEYEPRHSFAELLARITQEEVTIYPIYFDTEYEVVVRRRGEDTHEAYVTARKQLQSIADETGGTLFRADRAEDLEGVYQRVASELQTLYSVAYNPKDKNYNGQWRNVSVIIKRPQGTVKTKRGFFAR